MFVHCTCFLTPEIEENLAGGVECDAFILFIYFNAQTVTDNVLQKMAQEVEAFKKSPSELDLKYEKYRNVLCHIQESLDNVK